MSGPIDYSVEGIKVTFPFDAYPSQLEMMKRVIRASMSRQNALLELPTGSGKSMALLCSALAWQQHEHEQRKIAHAIKESEASSEDMTVHSMKEKKVRVPPIIYCSRTHSQLQQVVKELRHSPYNPVTSVLASRDRYCINTQVRKSANVGAECRKQLDSNGCGMFLRVQRLSASMPPVWDVEDLVSKGKSQRGCPYFAAKTISESANLILCPYNYLIDPVIRRSLQIPLDDAVVIIDEAQYVDLCELNFLIKRSNIEDTACEMASTDVSMESLVEILKALQQLDYASQQINEEGLATAAQRMYHLVSQMRDWLGTCSQQTPSTMHSGSGTAQLSETMLDIGFEKSAAKWTGSAALELMKGWGISSDTVDVFKDAMTTMTEKQDEDEDEKLRLPRLDGNASLILDRIPGNIARIFTFRLGLFAVFDFMLSVEDIAADTLVTNAQHYNVVVQKERTRTGWSVTVHFWCMLPKVAFKPLADRARSVILASGTLSPMTSFSSELGVTFHETMEGAHVVHPSQVWVGSLASGPRGKVVRLTHQNTSQLDTQDDIGATVVNICRVTPCGVLLFAQSYSMLEKLWQRWETTGIMKQLCSLKTVVRESAGGGPAFDEMLSTFREAAMKGALLMGVARGKASEGVDFADHQARAVIILGLPYPNLKDLRVELKREYNNLNRVRHSLIDGSQWYALQAFRAINQCAGRAIRHRHDFGAIIFIDERFTFKANTQQLSSWLRRTELFPKFGPVVSSLHAFFKHWKTEAVPSSNEILHTNPLLRNSPILCTEGSEPIISTIERPVLLTPSACPLPPTFPYPIESSRAVSSLFPSPSTSSELSGSSWLSLSDPVGILSSSTLLESTPRISQSCPPKRKAFIAVEYETLLPTAVAAPLLLGDDSDDDFASNLSVRAPPKSHSKVPKRMTQMKG